MLAHPLHRAPRRTVAMVLSLIGMVWMSGAGAPARAANASEPQRIETGLTLDTPAGVRAYSLVRARAGSTKRPLVLLFHGHGGSADQMLGLDRTVSPFRPVIDRALADDVVVAALDGEVGSDGKRGWNDCRADASTNPGSDDVAAVAALLDHLVRTADVDVTKVYAVGMSNGAMFTLRLALESGARFAGFAAVAGALPMSTECSDTSIARPVLVINGTADPLVRFGGGPVGGESPDRGNTRSVPETVAELIRRNASVTRATVVAVADRDRTDRSTVKVATYAARRGGVGAPVFVATVDGGGHVAPSIAGRVSRAYERFVGPQNHDIETADLIWSTLQIGRAARTS